MTGKPRGVGAFDLATWTAIWREPLEDLLRNRVADAWPELFGTALAYPLSTGGKRIRPALCVAAFQATADEPDDLSRILPAAAAVELVHTYSLVHDDLPCMDDDALRRGKPTVHVAFGEAAAVLCGDALLTEAFGVLAEATWPAALRVELVALLARSAGHRGMVGGQAADVGIGGRIGDRALLERLHAHKTGALLTWSAVAGGLVGGADARGRDVLRAYGQAVGLAFQLVDDLLDAEEVTPDGSPPSFVALIGLEETRSLAHELVQQAVALASSLERPDALVALARFVVERDR